ncbi:MAG: hypothetical protein ABL994_01660 [Verrucomicrobiales bacterium]
MSSGFYFQYREVGFGTRFKKPADPSTIREKDSRKIPEPDVLCANELVVDVGNACLDYGGETQMIFDHHLERPDNFPSAAAAVIHHLEAITQWAAQLKEGSQVWLVTHKNPDFDAVTSRYLLRQILDGKIRPKNPGAATGPADVAEIDLAGHGIHPEGWKSGASGKKEIDWRNPFLSHTHAKDSWPILLAACASAVDNGWKVFCPRERSPHAVLYMAANRGFPLLEWNDPACRGIKFMDHLRDRIIHQKLNPLYDSLFEVEADDYRAELALLDREAELYRKDVARARRCYVSIPFAKTPYATWSERVANIPFFKAGGQVDPRHLEAGCEERRKCDAIFLRDPESLLFKEWAREDRENSLSGGGFVFTAVCYSRRRPRGDNPDQYIFALDPERADGLHLYPLWARLQEAAFQAERISTNFSEEATRWDFKGRRVGPDPWYDGNAYAATIIDTPNQGTGLASAQTDGLTPRQQHSRNPGGIPTVEDILRRELESSWFKDPSELSEIVDFPCYKTSDCTLEQVAYRNHSVWKTTRIRVTANSLRYSDIELNRSGVEPYDAALAHQIGQLLWGVIEVEGIETVPTDFDSRHLVQTAHNIVVWNRRGAVVGWFGEEGKAYADQIRQWLKKIATIRMEVQELLKSGETTLRFEKSDQLLKDVVELRYDAAQPSGRVLRTLIEATSFEGLITSLYEWNQNDTSVKNLTAIKHTQEKVESVEIFLISVYALYFAYYLGSSFDFEGFYVGWAILGASFVALLVGWIKLFPHPGRVRKWLAKNVLRPLVVFLIAIALIFVYVFYGLSHKVKKQSNETAPTAAQVVAVSHLIRPPGSSSK